MNLCPLAPPCSGGPHPRLPGSEDWRGCLGGVQIVPRFQPRASREVSGSLGSPWLHGTEGAPGMQKALALVSNLSRCPWHLTSHSPKPHPAVSLAGRV